MREGRPPLGIPAIVSGTDARAMTREKRPGIDRPATMRASRTAGRRVTQSSALAFRA
jgi:hypothetical protein